MTMTTLKLDHDTREAWRRVQRAWGLDPDDGLPGPKTAAEALRRAVGTGPRMEDPADPAPWLTYARTFLGEKEVPGRESNPRILEILREFLPAAMDDSTVAWCGAFAAHCLRRHGMAYPREMPLLARAYLETGTATTHPREGDIVVFWRGSRTSWQGHVAFYLSGQGTGSIRVLGGNQTDAVTETIYQEDRVLGYRRPIRGR